MSKFIKVTEIRREQHSSNIGFTTINTKIPRIINVDCIISAEDNLIHFADHKLRVAETLEQIIELIEVEEDETRVND